MKRIAPVQEVLDILAKLGVTSQSFQAARFEEESLVDCSDGESLVRLISVVFFGSGSTIFLHFTSAASLNKALELLKGVDFQLDADLPYAGGIRIPAQA